LSDAEAGFSVQGFWFWFWGVTTLSDALSQHFDLLLLLVHLLLHLRALRLYPPVRVQVQGSGFRVQGSGFRVQGSRFRVQGLGFRVAGGPSRVDPARKVEPALGLI